MIEYCLSNVDDETRRYLAVAPETIESPCLEHCGICCSEPFLVVDGTLHRIDTHETCLEAHTGNDQ